MAAAIVGAGFKPAHWYETHDTRRDPCWQPKAESRAEIDRHETPHGTAPKTVIMQYPLPRLPIPPNAARPPVFHATRVEFLRWELLWNALNQCRFGSNVHRNQRKCGRPIPLSDFEEENEHDRSRQHGQRNSCAHFASTASNAPNSQEN